jgi:hypothetical protein
MLNLQRNLGHLAHSLSLGRRFYYMAPRPSLADYLAAQSVGGTPVRGYKPTQPLAPGTVVTFEASDRISLRALTEALGDRGLRIVSLGQLLAAERRTST